MAMMSLMGHTTKKVYHKYNVSYRSILIIIDQINLFKQQQVKKFQFNHCNLKTINNFSLTVKNIKQISHFK